MILGTAFSTHKLGRDPRLEPGRVPGELLICAERHEAEPVLADRGDVHAKVALPYMLALGLAAAGQHAIPDGTRGVGQARARQEGDFKRMRRGGEDRRRRRMVAAGPSLPKIPPRRIATLGPYVAEDQPFEGSPVPWLHILGRTSLLSDTTGSRSAAPGNNECA